MSTKIAQSDERRPGPSVLVGMGVKLRGQIVAVSCGYGTCFAVMGYATSYFPLIMFGYHSDSNRSYGTQKLTRSTLALKLSVSPPYYPWVTAAQIMHTYHDHFAFWVPDGHLLLPTNVDERNNVWSQNVILTPTEIVPFIRYLSL